MSFCSSVCPSFPLDVYLRILISEHFFRKPVEKIEFSFKSDKYNGYSHEDLCAFFIISRSVLLRMINVSDKIG